MGYFAYSSVRFRVRAGTTCEQVRAAGALLSSYFDASSLPLEGPLLENGVNFRPGDLEVFVGVNAKVDDKFADLIFKPVMKAFGELVDQPFSALLLWEGGAPPPDDVVVSDVFGPAEGLVEQFPLADPSAAEDAGQSPSCG